MLWLIFILLLVSLLYFYKNEIEVRTITTRPMKKGGPRIGIISSWARQGVPYQSRFLSKCLSAKHEVYIFAYKNFIKDEANWGYKKLVYTKVIKPWKVISWIKKEKIKVVFFPDRLEDRSVLEWCKRNKVATIMQINYETIKKQEFSRYNAYTILHCPVKCTQDLLKRFGFLTTRFIRWGIDNSIFYAKKRKISLPIRFFHNAGHGGIEWRKNTLAVVEAFDAASKKNNDITLLISSQKPLKEYPDVVQQIIKKNKRISMIDRELKMQELIKLYRSCHISLLPSKWEGIGIPFLESLAMGLPVITVDAPPMNEWIKNGSNGFCAKVARWEERKDRQLLVKGAIVDTADLSRLMLKLSDVKLLNRMVINAVKSTKNSKTIYTSKLEKLIKSLCR
jgi:glycosyltransferase involved in cell wall biosynthesis